MFINIVLAPIPATVERSGGSWSNISGASRECVTCVAWVNVLVADAEEVKKQLVQCFSGEIHHLGLPFPSRLPLRLRRVYYWCITSVTGITGAISI